VNFMPAAHDPYAALRSRDYRFLLASGLLASTAAEMQATALGWDLYRRTREPWALGLVGLVLFLPVILLSIPAGHAADRYNRKGLLVLAQLLAIVASSGLVLLSAWKGPIPAYYLCILLAGISQALAMPARWSLLPLVVPEQDLTNAVTWNSSSWQVASLLGPSLAGLLLERTREPHWVYLLAAHCALVCAACILFMRPRPAQRSREVVSLRTLAQGFRFVWKTRPILATITLDLFAVLLGGATALLPIFQEDILHVDDAWLGWLRAAPALGALVMAIGLAHRPPLRRPGLAMLWAVAGFGVATIAFGLSKNAYLSFFLLAMTGALDNISVVVRGTLVQVLTPEAMRGRVSAVNAIFISSSNELGAFESGFTAAYFGPIASVVGGGVGTVLVVLAVALVWPEVLRLGKLEGAASPAGQEGESGLSAEEFPSPRHLS
jgi:MFS family permease